MAILPICTLPKDAVLRRKAKKVHVIDHLNGILYIDHVENSEKLYKIQPIVTGGKAGIDGSEVYDGE